MAIIDSLFPQTSQISAEGYLELVLEIWCFYLFISAPARQQAGSWQFLGAGGKMDLLRDPKTTTYDNFFRSSKKRKFVYSWLKNKNPALSSGIFYK